MIGQPMNAEQQRKTFEQLLKLALLGDAPPTENGLDDAVVDALYLVVAQRTPQSAQAAKTVFEDKLGT